MFLTKQFFIRLQLQFTLKTQSGIKKRSSPHLTQFTIQIDDLTPEENQSGMKNHNCPK